MTPTRFLLMLFISVLVSVPIVWFAPRARRSSFFDRLLWLATIVVAFLCAWLALGYAANGSFGTLSSFLISDLPVVPALLGAVVGALVLNLSLWAIDLFNQQTGEEEDWEEYDLEEEEPEEQDVEEQDVEEQDVEEQELQKPNANGSNRNE